MAIRYRISLAAALVASTGLATAQGLTEQEALQRFEQHSPQVRVLEARLKVAQAESRIGLSPPNPNVSVSRENAGGSADLFVTGEQTVPLSGRRGLLRRAGEAAAAATREEIRHELLRLRAEVRTAFHALLGAQAREQALASSLQELQEILRVLREREREGESSGYDVLRAEQEVLDYQTQLTEAQAEMVAARQRLTGLLGLGDTLQVRGELAPGLLPPVVEELVERAKQRRGDLAGQLRQRERYQFDLRAGERLKIPEPTVAIGLKRVTATGFSDAGYVASVTVPLPLFNRGHAELTLARAQQERTAANLTALEAQIHAEVRAGYERLQLRRAAAEQAIRRSGAAPQELARIARLSYEEGERGIFELLDAIRVATAAQIRSLDLFLKLKEAEVLLDLAVGEEVTR